MEGTYPLPEAQLDRFFFKLTVGYPSAEDELMAIAERTTGTATVRGADGADRITRAAHGMSCARELPIAKAVLQLRGPS